MTAIQGATVLVTGGGRGLGKALVDDLLARGAKKVYATARSPKPSNDPRVVPLALEVTDPASVAAVAEQAQDVTVLVNNAGVSNSASFLDGPVDDVRAEFETNFYGVLHLVRAFAPIIERNGGGHVLNVHSVLSWVGLTDGYSASKAAVWSMSNSLRLALKPKGIGVTGLHVGYIDTDMAAHIDAPKSSPESVAKQALDGVESGAHEVLADDLTRQVKAGLSQDVSVLYPQLAS
ncbi:Short-chain dehydrogenase [Amycolatopsis xylanica]|uniref:Short-chain dehydrogenase n=1 Tax=Amycolatopsis xylanica TaxID=589385 RepID=A0A1H3SL92_9PSEU|nr:SDR family oxidoreductase [Amycolatopsis xylanica]SDZ38843.1 Short-chain dehydrogenase [Amycolatopsis xylanica]